jgi:hypothetical protein
MKCLAQFAACFYMLTTSAQEQQIASVDLTHPTVPTKPTVTQELPKGCEKLLPGSLFDGAVMPPNHERREIVVAVVKLNNENPILGSEVQGEVQLRNSGEYSIKIPWSTDPNITKKGENPNSLSWEVGGFNIVLKPGGELENISQSLFGSRFSPGSELTMRPGEWVAALLKFKLALQYELAGRPVRTGKRELFAEWVQGAGSKGIKNCAVASGWFQYRDYYRQQNPTVTINVK